jgi:hypothetical protein
MPDEAPPAAAAAAVAFAAACEYVIDLPLAAKGEAVALNREVVLARAAAALEAEAGAARDAAAAAACACPPPGRLGPDSVTLDRKSASPHAVISEDGLTLESARHFSSARATACVVAGCWAFEALLGTSGLHQIGFCTHRTPFTIQEGARALAAAWIAPAGGLRGGASRCRAGA